VPQAFAVSTLMLLILTSYFTGALSIVSAKGALWKLLTERTSPPLDWRRLCAAKVHDKRSSVSARPLKRFAIALFRNLISSPKGLSEGARCGGRQSETRRTSTRSDPVTLRSIANFDYSGDPCLFRAFDVTAWSQWATALLRAEPGMPKCMRQQNTSVPIDPRLFGT
jgi:hypothetical protein